MGRVRKREEKGNRLIDTPVGSFSRHPHRENRGTSNRPYARAAGSWKAKTREAPLSKAALRVQDGPRGAQGAPRGERLRATAAGARELFLGGRGQRHKVFSAALTPVGGADRRARQARCGRDRVLRGRRLRSAPLVAIQCRNADRRGGDEPGHYDAAPAAARPQRRIGRRRRNARDRVEPGRRAVRSDRDAVGRKGCNVWRGFDRYR